MQSNQLWFTSMLFGPGLRGLLSGIMVHHEVHVTNGAPCSPATCHFSTGLVRGLLLDFMFADLGHRSLRNHLKAEGDSACAYLSWEPR